MDDLELCRDLVQRVDERRCQDPGRALAIALAARELAAAMGRDELGEDGWLELQTEAWGALASAYRAVGRLRMAEGSLNVALAFWRARPGVCARAQARLAQRASYLRCDQRRCDEALELNAEALEIYARLDERQLLGGTLVDRALILRQGGRIPEAMEHLAAALDLLDRQLNPRSYLAAVHNMAVHLYETAETPEDHVEAERWLRLAVREHARFPETLSLLKLRGVAALVAFRLDRVEEATAELWRVRARLRRRGAAHDEMIVLLHLAGIAVIQDRFDDVQRVAGEMFPLLRKVELDRETYASVRRLLRAAQSRQLTFELVESVTRDVEHSRPADL